MLQKVDTYATLAPLSRSLTLFERGERVTFILQTHYETPFSHI